MTNVEPIIEAVLAGADPFPLGDDGRFYTVVVPEHGKHVLVDLQAEVDKLRDTPRRKTGHYRVHDAESFVAYVSKHGDVESEVWADTPNAKIVGVLNAHIGDRDDQQTTARFEDHRVEYAVLLTEAWKRWVKFDGQLLDQQDFAEFIEERAIDVVRPTGAEMLEVAQTFKATVGVHVESSTRLSTGQRQFKYHEEIDGKAGKAGQLEIPETFDLALRPFEGADAFKVTARLRYRMTDGALRMGYKLERPEDVIREAFLSVVQKVQIGIAELDLLSTPIFLGSR
jgi:uncharacterized protein YfdQ (DUF2303 family)